MNPVPVFDGHNDVLLRLWIKTGGDPVSDFLQGDGQGHLDFPRMRKGGFAGGFFAIFAPTDGEDLPDDDEGERDTAAARPVTAITTGGAACAGRSQHPLSLRTRLPTQTA